MGFSSVQAGTALYKYSVQLVVAGQGISIPAVACDIHCGIIRDSGSMPQATVVVPVGSTLGNGPSQGGNAFAQLAGVSRNEKVIITYASDATAAVLFEGYISGISIVRTSASYGVAVTVVHWMSGLDGSSAFFSGLTAAYGAAVTREISNLGATTGATAYTLNQAITTLSQTGPWPLYLEAAALAIKTIAAQLPGGSQVDSNAAGLAMLNRIKSKLTLTTAGSTLATHSSRALKAMVGTLMLANETRAQTLLGKTLVFCNMMSTMLVPHSQDVYIVPDGIFNALGAVSIPDSEQSSAHLKMSKNIPLGGCALIAPGGKAEDGLTMTLPTGPVLSYNSGEPGPIMSAQPPPWMAGVAMQDMQRIPFSVGGKGWHGASRHTVKPPKIACTVDDTASLIGAATAAGIEYCKLMYAKTMTEGSGGTVTGPLRFDIAPGATVIVEGPGGGGKLYALVEGIRIRMDTEAGDMSTSFELSHMRTETEQAKYDAIGDALYVPQPVNEPYA